MPITTRGVIGMFYNQLSQNTGESWVDRLSMHFPNSDQPQEEYPWLGAAPAMRKWVGGRQSAKLRDNAIIIKNERYEATLEIDDDWLRRDKTGQIQIRIAEMAAREKSHWAKLISNLILTARSTVCYDGQYFFDTDHSEGASGTQSNDITVDISELPVNIHGSITQPSVSEMKNCIYRGIQQMMSFRDDRGEPTNENIRSFIVMVPTALWSIAQSAATAPVIDGGDTNDLSVNGNLKIDVVVNPRLDGNSNYSSAITVFVDDAVTGPFITQDEGGLNILHQGEGSDYFFDNKIHRFGIDASRGAGYGYWQQACRVEMV